MLIDYHIHTEYVKHATGKIADICREAERKGFSEICFTEHQEFEHQVKDRSSGPSHDDWERYMTDIESARKEFGLEIKTGVELGYDVRYIDSIRSFCKEFDFDYVIGSIHFLDGYPISSRKLVLAGTIDLNGFYRRYFAAMAEMAKILDIDCVGHMDVLKKMLPQVPMIEYINELKGVIDVMKMQDIGFELNTSGWRTKAAMCYPDPEIVKFLYNSGIRKVTIGSDCHRPEDLGYRINDGLEVLRKTGFTQVCTFEKRKARFLPI